MTNSPYKLTPREEEQLKSELVSYANEGASDDDLRKFRDAFVTGVKKKEPSEPASTPSSATSTAPSEQPTEPSATSGTPWKESLEKFSIENLKKSPVAQTPVQTDLRAVDIQAPADALGIIPPVNLEEQNKREEAVPGFKAMNYRAFGGKRAKEITLPDKVDPNHPETVKQGVEATTLDYLDYVTHKDSNLGNNQRAKYEALLNKPDKTASDEDFLRRIEAEALEARYGAEQHEMLGVLTQIEQEQDPMAKNRLMGKYGELKKNIDGIAEAYKANPGNYLEIATKEGSDKALNEARQAEIEENDKTKLGKIENFADLLFKGAVKAIGEGTSSIAQVPKVLGDMVGDEDFDVWDKLYDEVQNVKFERQSDFGTGGLKDLPMYAKIANIGGQALGSAMMFAGGGMLGASTIGPRAATFTTAFLSSEPGYYEEALAAGLSPQKAATAATYLASVTAAIESIIPDVKYFEPSAFRNSVIGSFQKGLSPQQAVKEAIRAMPETAKAYLKSGVKEGGEEIAGQLGEDVAKESINAIGGTEYFKDTFNPESYAEAALGGFMAGTGLNVFSRPGPKSSLTEQTMLESVENKDAVLNGVPEEQKAEVETVLTAAEENLEALKKHSNWENLSREDQAHALALTQDITALEEEQKAINSVRLMDAAKEDQIKALEEELNKTFETKETKTEDSSQVEPESKLTPETTTVPEGTEAAKPLDANASTTPSLGENEDIQNEGQRATSDDNSGVPDTDPVVEEKDVQKEKAKAPKEKLIGVTNAHTEAVRRAAGLDPVAKQAARSNESLWNNMVSRIESGEIDAREEVRKMAASKVSPTDENQAVVLFDRVRITNEKEMVSEMLERAVNENSGDQVELAERMAELEMESQLNDTANTNLGTEWGRTGQFRQLLSDREYSAVSLIRDATILNRGKELSPEQKQKFEKLASDYEELQRKFARLEREKAPKEPAPKATNTQKAKEIADRIRKLKTQPIRILDSNGKPIEIVTQGFTWNDILEAGAVAIEKGGQIADAIGAMVEKLKEHDWYNNLSDQDRQAVQDQLTDQLEGQDQLEKAKASGQKRVEKLTEKIEAKDFTSKQKRQVKPDPELRAINRQLRELEEKIEYEKEKIRIQNLKGKEGFKENITDILNTPKSLVSGLDLSAPLRQGAVLAPMNPRAFGKAFATMLQHAVSQEAHDNWLRDLKSTDEYQELKEYGLYIAEANAKMSAREESYLSRYFQHITKIPIYGHLMRGSQRAYIGFLNRQRVEVFRTFRDDLEANGVTGEELDAELKAFASFVNNATGRGHLGFAEAAAPVLNGVMFSPRLLASRVNLMNPVFYGSMPKRAMKQAIMSVLAFAGTAALIGVLAKLGWGCPDDCTDCDDCVQIETDWRSSDFLKIRIGNTRYDILGGFQQILRTVGQAVSGERKNTETGEVGEINSLEAVGDFFVNKSAPTVGVAMDIVRGEERFTGEPTTVGGELQKLLMPIPLQSAIEMYDEKGLGGTIAPTVIGAFGVGVQYYGSVQQEAEKIYYKKLKKYKKKTGESPDDEVEETMREQARSEAERNVVRNQIARQNNRE